MDVVWGDGSNFNSVNLTASLQNERRVSMRLGSIGILRQTSVARPRSRLCRYSSICFIERTRNLNNIP
jgi:hypothetical protein